VPGEEELEEEEEKDEMRQMEEIQDFVGRTFPPYALGQERIMSYKMEGVGADASSRGRTVSAVWYVVHTCLASSIRRF